MSGLQRVNRKRREGTRRVNPVSLSEELQTLREFTDEYLLTDPPGQAFANFYYQVRPPIDEFIADHPNLKPIVRAGLVPVVTISTIAVKTGSAENMAIISLMVLASVAVAIWAIRRRGSKDGSYSV